MNQVTRSYRFSLSLVGWLPRLGGDLSGRSYILGMGYLVVVLVVWDRYNLLLIAGLSAGWWAIWASWFRRCLASRPSGVARSEAVHIEAGSAEALRWLKEVLEETGDQRVPDDFKTVGKQRIGTASKK
jgi:hypothetical protein